jgi:hypothetical protein
MSILPSSKTLLQKLASPAQPFSVTPRGARSGESSAALIGTPVWHPSYCRHHAARSVLVEEPVPFVRPRVMAAAW